VLRLRHAVWGFAQATSRCSRRHSGISCGTGPDQRGGDRRSRARGSPRALSRNVALLADALSLSAAERAEFEQAAEHARGRQSPARGESSPRHNLPIRLTSFVGREEEIAQIKALLGADRLVSLTGSGGVGKTRIALEVARQLLDEAQTETWFIDLSPVSDGSFVAGALASVLDVSLARVAEPLPSLAARLKTRKLPLVLDNCEHVIADAAAAAATILRACPGISILATSRERLAIEGERTFEIEFLDPGVHAYVFTFG
jgi:hypothetical protein